MTSARIEKPQQNMLRRTTPQNGMRESRWQDPFFKVQNPTHPSVANPSPTQPERGRIQHPSGTPTPRMRRHSEGYVVQLSRRRGSRVLRRGAGGVVEDVENLLLPCVHSSPPPPSGLRLVATRECVRDVVGRRHPLEVRCPSMGCGQAPDRGHHAVVVAIALGEGAQSGDVVDVRRP